MRCLYISIYIFILSKWQSYFLEGWETAFFSFNFFSDSKSNTLSTVENLEKTEGYLTHHTKYKCHRNINIKDIIHYTSY